MNITAKTQKVGLLGWPLSHSLSPAMQNAAFAASGLDYVYLPLPTPPELLPQAIAGLRALGFRGVNVTIPHKVAVIDYLDDIDASAKLVGAVNTIVNQDGRLIGYNTDADGYIGSLKAAGVAIAGKHAVVLGAGGAARAVVAGLTKNGISSIAIGARELGKATCLAQLFTRHGVTITGIEWNNQSFTSALAGADIIVNTTPLGMYPDIDSQPPIPWDNLKSSAIISDLVYNPLVTSFMKTAANLGHKVIAGDGMLVSQGALAFTLWTAKEAPQAVMSQALTNGLR